MKAQSDSRLLRAFAERRSEAALAELVRRLIDLVQSAAVRMVNDPHLAKDVSEYVDPNEVRIENRYINPKTGFAVLSSTSPLKGANERFGNIFRLEK